MQSPAYRRAAGARERWWKPSDDALARSRGLFSFLLWKDLRIRYKQTFMGIVWVALQPLLEMVIFTVMFGHFFDQDIGGAPYPLFAYAGLLPWTYLSVAVLSGTQSLVAHSDILLRIYFPRFLLPIANAFAKLADLGIACSVLLLLLIILGVPVTVRIVLLVPAIFLLFLTAAGLSLWLSALHAMYRDVGLIVPYFLRISLFLTPVIYPVHSIPMPWRAVLWANPMTSVVELFRAALLPGQPIPGRAFLISIVCISMLFGAGLVFFRSSEDRILDVL